MELWTTAKRSLNAKYVDWRCVMKTLDKIKMMAIAAFWGLLVAFLIKLYMSLSLAEKTMQLLFS